MPLTTNWGLYTDYYELTMAQGYFYCNKKEDSAVFNYFFRTNPFKSGFTVFAGLQDFLNMLAEFRFSVEAIEYFYKETGIRLTHEDFIDEGYYNTTFRVPT